MHILCVFLCVFGALTCPRGGYAYCRRTMVETSMVEPSMVETSQPMLETSMVET